MLRATKLFLYKVWEQVVNKVWIAAILLFLFSFSSAYAQTVAAIKANGKAVSRGDTVSICVGGHIIFESSAVNYSSLFWSFENGTPLNGFSGYQDITFNIPGIDTTWQIARSSIGASDTTYVLVQVNNVAPVANFSFSPDGQCGNVPVNFTNASSGTGLSYVWNFGDNATSTQTNPSHPFLNAIGVSGSQSYNVSLLVTNNQYCRDSITKTVTVKKVPDASIGNADPGVVYGEVNGIPTFKRCSNAMSYPFQFINQSTTPSIITRYTISWGDGSPDSVLTTFPPGTVFGHVYGHGVHDITITALGNNGCIGIKKVSVFLGTTPAGGFSSLGGASICSPNIQSFVISGFLSNPPGTTYTINVNDGTSPVVYQHAPPDTISHLFNDGSCGNNSSNGAQTFPNSFRATLDIENPCGITSFSVIPIYVSGKPKAKISVNPYLCINSTTSISNTSISGGTVIQTGGGNSTCVNNATSVWTISPSSGYSIMAGSFGSINNSPGNPLLWTPGSTDVDVSFSTPGIYTVKLYVGNGLCGMDSITRVLCVRDVSASFTINNHVSCGSDIVTMNNTSPTAQSCIGDIYNWEIVYSDPLGCGNPSSYAFVNGTNSASFSPQINFINPGRYIIRLYVYANGTYNCYATASDTFLVKGKPSVKINPVTGACLGNSISPTASVINCYSNGGISYNWTFSNGSPASSTLQVPGSVGYAAMGTHPIILQTTNECGTSADTANAIVIPFPSANAGPDKIICSGDPAQIGTLPSSGITYQWFPATGLSNTAISNPLVTLTYSGPSPDTTYTYVVSGSASGTGCVGSDTVLITVKKTPVVTVSPLTSQVCAGSPVQLVAGGALNYTWSPATGLSSAAGSVVTATPFTTTTYTVVGAIAGGCFATASAIITVSPSPVVNAGLDTVMCSFSPPAQFTATPAGGTWSGSPYVSAGGVFNPAASGNGNFTLTYTASLGSCFKADTIVVTVIDAPIVRAGNDSTFCQDSSIVQLPASPAGGRWSGSPYVTATGLFNTIAIGTYTLVYTYGSGLCIGRDTVLVSVTGGITNNIISANQSVCTGNIPATITGQNITGGIGTPLYQWQVSTNGVFWNDITGATAKDYSPAALTQATWYRRLARTSICSGANASVPVLISINPNAKADFNPLLVSGCPPFSITSSIINLTTYNGISEYRWYANNIYLGSGQNFPGYALLNNNDSVTIKLVAISSTGCKNDSVQHGFKASGTPLVNAGPDSTICQGSFPLQLVGFPAGGSWSGSSLITLSGIFTPSTPGSFNVAYTYGSGTCIGKDTITIIVGAGITNNIIGGNQSICEGTLPALISGQPVIGGLTTPVYQWQSSTDSLNWINISGATTKDYQPALLSQASWFRRVVSTSVCSGLQSVISLPVKIAINPNAKALFNPTNTSGCAPFTITPFIINLTSAASVSEYRWYINGSYAGSGQSFPGYTITNNNDSVTIRLVAISRYGCKNDSLQYGFVTADAPSPSFNQSDSTGCGPLTVTFANTTPNTSRYNYIWNFGNGQISTILQPGPVTYAPAFNNGDTVYNIRMTAITTCDTISVLKTVTVRGKPKAVFAPDRIEACSPMTVTFTNISRGTNVNYVWDFGDGTAPLASNSATIQHTYTAGARTTFNIKLKATNDCGSDSVTQSLIVNANAIRVFYSVSSNELIGCAPHMVHFINNTIGATSFRYDFGDGTFLNTTRINDTIAHTYTSVGTYNATLKATGICNDTTSAIIIAVKTRPAVSFSSLAVSACVGDTMRFVNTSDTATVSFWQFGDGSTAYTRNPAKAYNAPGNYRVWLSGSWTVGSPAGCSDSAYHDIIIRDTLPGTFIVGDSVSSCIPFTTVFKTLNGPSAQTLWNFGDGAVVTGDTVSHTYMAPGTFNVRMISRSLSGCTYTQNRVIQVNAPAGTLVYNNGYACLNQNVRFEVRGGTAARYIFYFGDGDSLTSFTNVVFHQFTSPGRFVPWAYLADGSCRIRISVGDTIKVDKIVAGFTSSSIRNCGATIVNFRDTSNAYFGQELWQWDFGDGTLSTSRNPAKVYTRDGTYYVQLLVTGVSGCIDTTRIPVNIAVRQYPSANIGSDTVACSGQTINFAALVQSQDSVVNVSWKFGNGSSGIGYNVSAVYNNTGTYVVELITTTLYGCADTVYKTVRVNAAPIVNAGSDLQICLGQTARLLVFGADTYRWSPVQSLSCFTCASPAATPQSSTQYVVYGTSALNCTSTDTVKVEVIQPFKIMVSGADTICVGESTQVFASGAPKYLWNPVSGLSSGTAPNPIANPTSTTRYMVIGNDNYTCFADTGYITVVVGPYPTVNLGSGATLLVGTNITLNPILGNGPFKNYIWTPADDLSCTNCPRPVATINKEITYKLEVENIYGCKSSDTVSYKVKCDAALQVYVPNAFSPDGDGLNDVFMVRGRGLAMVKYFRVFNRWGQLVFEKSNFAANDKKFGWDGKVNGVPSNPDVFVYTVEVICAAGDVFVKKGNVTLVR